MQENQIIEQISQISNNWENFLQDYNQSKNQILQLQAAAGRPEHADSNYAMQKNAFSHYLRKGEISLEAKSFMSSDSESGGIVISPTLSTEIIQNIQESSPLRKIFGNERISTNELDIIIEEGEFETGWVLESQERKETKAPKLKQKKIMVHELYAQPMATQRLIDDSSIDIAQWLMLRLVDYFCAVENIAFINGDGINKPKGILADEGIKSIKTSQEGVIDILDIISLMKNLNQHYFSNATFIMHRSTLSYIQTLKDDSGRFIWQPSYSEMQPQTLFGIPLQCCDEMPTMEKGKKVIALGDFKKGYKIVDRSGVSVIRDYYTHKPFIKFYTTKRVGGDVVNAAAIKLLECS